MSDWLASKPYSNPTDYDQEYLEVTRKIHKVLLQSRPVLKGILTDPYDFINLSVCITSYLEDIVNDIGIWRVLIETHEELFQAPIPFYTTDEYQKGQLNVEDVLFILFSFHYLTAKVPINPFYLPFMPIAQVVMEVLSEEFEYVPETDFYEKYFTLEDDASFFEVKEKLTFMALDSYLLNRDFKTRYKEDIEDLMDNPPPSIRELDDMGPLIYQMKDVYLFKEISSFSGLSAGEWFIRLSNPHEETAEAIRNLHKIVNGIFFYERSDDSYHYFVEIDSETSIEIVKDSVEIDTRQAGKLAALMQLVSWKDEWWMSGAFMGWPVQSYKDARDKFNQDYPNTNFWLEAPKIQQSLIERTEHMYEVFINLFGKEYALAWTLEELNQLGKSYFKAYHKSIGAKNIKSNALPGIAEDLTEEDFERGMGIAFIKGNGIAIIPGLPYYLNLLSTKKVLTDEEALDLFYFFYVDGLPPQLLPNILQEFPDYQPKYPSKHTDIDVRSLSDYLLRLFQPESFRKTPPSLTMY